MELDLAAQLPREGAPDRGYREQRQAVGYLWTRTTGTRTISSIDPSRGLRSKTSTLPSVSTRGSAYVAAIVNVPRSGAPALAVVIPSASGRPEVSTMRQLRFASNTLASPLIVRGLLTRLFASGRRTTMKPRAETSAVGEGAPGVTLTVGDAVRATAEDVRVGDGPGACEREERRNTFTRTMNRRIFPSPFGSRAANPE